MYSNESEEAIAYYELIVIGLGLVGSSTLYEAAKLLNPQPTTNLGYFDRRAPKVLGIDQFKVPHQSGSSHGEKMATKQEGLCKL